jgi:hypothetical protein
MYQLMMTRLETLTAFDSVRAGDVSSMRGVAGSPGDEDVDMSAYRTIDELESLWEDYPTLAAYIYGPTPPEGPVGVGKTDFAYLLEEIGERVFPDLNVASNNETDEFLTLTSWSEVEEWLKTTDGPKLYILDEAAQVLQYADMTAGKAISQFLKLIRKYNGNIIIIGHTGRDIARDVRRQMLIVRKDSKTSATIGTGLSEENEEIQIADEMMSLTNIPATRVEYDTLDEGEFEFDWNEYQSSSSATECKVTIKSDDNRDDKKAGIQCGNETSSGTVCEECADEYDEEYLQNYRGS